MPRPSVPRIVAGARACVGDVYDPAYVSLRYPGGDVPRGRGACTDVVVRALRAAGIDLQQKVHEDMRRHFDRYPKAWGLRRPDPSIDHRRVPNLRVFLTRQGAALRSGSPFLAGDIVTWDLGSGRGHIGIVSDRRTPDRRRPLVIHNVGPVCAEEDALRAWKITGHYRYPRRG